MCVSPVQLYVRCGPFGVSIYGRMGNEAHSALTSRGIRWRFRLTVHGPLLLESETFSLSRSSGPTSTGTVRTQRRVKRCARVPDRTARGPRRGAAAAGLRAPGRSVYDALHDDNQKRAPRGLPSRAISRIDTSRVTSIRLLCLPPCLPHDVGCHPK